MCEGNFCPLLVANATTDKWEVHAKEQIFVRVRNCKKFHQEVLPHQPDNFVILASFSENKQGIISGSKITTIWNKPCVQVNVGLVQLNTRAWNFLRTNFGPGWTTENFPKQPAKNRIEADERALDFDYSTQRRYELLSNATTNKCMKQQSGYPKRGEVGHMQTSSPCSAEPASFKYDLVMFCFVVNDFA